MIKKPACFSLRAFVPMSEGRVRSITKGIVTEKHLLEFLREQFYYVRLEFGEDKYFGTNGVSDSAVCGRSQILGSFVPVE